MPVPPRGPAILHDQADAPRAFGVEEETRRAEGQAVAAQGCVCAGRQKDRGASAPDHLFCFSWGDEEIDQRVAKSHDRILARCAGLLGQAGRIVSVTSLQSFPRGNGQTGWSE